VSRLVTIPPGEQLDQIVGQIERIDGRWSSGSSDA
jgi:hypothetical protein